MGRDCVGNITGWVGLGFVEATGPMSMCGSVMLIYFVADGRYLSAVPMQSPPSQRQAALSQSSSHVPSA